MTNVLKMMKLDFFTIKSQLFSYLSLIFMVFMFEFIGSSVTILCFTGAWFVALMSTNIFAEQEKNHLERLYGSVSITLNDIVLGRYIFVFLNYFMSFLLIIVLNFGFALYRSTPVEVLDLMLGFSLSFLAFSTITGIQIPMFFKMGYTKAKIWSLLPFSLVILPLIIPAFAPALFHLAGFMQSYTKTLVIGGILASCMLQFLSYNISVILYRKRKAKTSM